MAASGAASRLVHHDATTTTTTAAASCLVPTTTTASCLVPTTTTTLVYLVHHEARAEEARALLDGHDVLEPARLVDRSEDQLVHVVAHLWRAPRRGESLGRGARRRAADASQCVAACVARRTFMTRVLNECESDLVKVRVRG